MQGKPSPISYLYLWPLGHKRQQEELRTDFDAKQAHLWIEKSLKAYAVLIMGSWGHLCSQNIWFTKSHYYKPILASIQKKKLLRNHILSKFWVLMNALHGTC
jgi:hypothetical protein